MSIAEVQEDIRRQLIGLLLEKVDGDRFPSSTQMDIIEQLLGPEEAEAYAEVLMRKIREDQFPSLDLIMRVRDIS